MPSKPSLAIISSYDELCGIASYTRCMENNLSKYFNITILPIHINPTIRSNKIAVERNFDEICRQLPSFDFVNIQFEGGIFGKNAKEIIKRTTQVINASKNLLLTFHRVELIKPTLRIKISQCLKDFLFDLRNRKLPRIFFPSEGKNGEVTQALMKLLKKRPASQPYHVIVHRNLELNFLKSTYGIPDNHLTAYPLVYFSKEKQASYREQLDATLWKKRKGIPDNTLTLGVFGFYGDYKGFSIAIDALTSLPDNYNLAIVGGQHPMNIQPHRINKTILELQSLLKDPNHATYSPQTKENLLKRVFFLGAESKDDDLIAAISAVDFVVLPYLEVGQSASGPASIALELNKPILLSRTLTFLEFEKFFPSSFEMFDIGHALELAHKVAHYDQSTFEHRQTAMINYNAEGLADIFYSQYTLMETVRS